MHQAVVALLSTHRSAFSEEMYFRQAALAFAAAHSERCTDRACTAGHFTASAWVLHPDRTRALLIHHRGLDRWFQPGGHVEPDDASLEAAARREVAEECRLIDLTLLQPGIFDLDIHLIPAKGDMPEHPHLDVRFCYVASNDTVHGQAAEIHDWAWRPLRELIGADTQQSVRRMALKTLQG